MFLQNSAYYLAKLKIIGGISMKKFTRIFSFLMALVFCFATMSLNILAVNDLSVASSGFSSCPDHPDAGYVAYAHETTGGTYFHYLYCVECGFTFSIQPCSFSIYMDCTQTAYCTECINSCDALYTNHDFSGVAWNDGGKLNYHWRKCKREGCWVEEHGNHDRAGDPVFKNDGVHKTCNLCGYEWPTE